MGWLKTKIGYGILLVLVVRGVDASPFECMIDASQIVEVRSPVTGLLQTVPVKRGDVVKAGQVLATLDSGVEQANVDVARYKAEMVGQVEASQSKVEMLHKKFDRAQKLYGQGSYVSAQEKEDAEQDLRVAEGDAKVALENQHLAELEWKQAQSTLDRRTLRSPFAGVVVDQYMYPGEYVGGNEAKKSILKLAQVSTLRVEAILPVSMYGKVKRGNKVTLIPEIPLQDGNIRGVIAHVDHIVDASSGTFGVLLFLNNPGNRIPAGIRCKMQL
ncbi:MAG: efflux RND transporter periplasmic adaptor subunit [Pseudomonadales bacterium]|nr:efflux RND transporter periplasmic adaptor subunit [Pseudomonadales bacterium]